MRIFSVFFHPASNFTAVGGAEKRFVEVLKVWTAQGIDITVVDPLPKLMFQSGVNCEVIEMQSPLRFSGKGLLSIYLEWLLWVIKACFLGPSLIKRKKYDVILTPNSTLPGLIVAYLVRLVSHTPLCVVAHHLDFPYTNVPVNFTSIYRVYRKAHFTFPTATTKALTSLMILTLLRRSEICITVSNYTAKVLLKNGLRQNKVHVSGNGIDTSFIDQFKTPAKLYDSVFVGRISRDKGVFDLITMWKQLILNRPDSRLLIIGTGPDSTKIKKLIEDSNLTSNIMLKGSCKDSELYSLLKASKIFAFPSVFEGWGLAVGEALACGLPVVCYDIPALHEIFGECKSAFLIPTGNIELFAETVEKILRNGDFGKLETISKEYVRRFTWKKVALRDLRIIRNFLLHEDC